MASYTPSGQSAPTIVIIRDERGKSEWNEDHEHPEPATLRSETRAHMLLYMIWSIATDAARIGYQTIWRALIPEGVAVLARVVVWQGCCPWHENAFVIGVFDIVELAKLNFGQVFLELISRDCALTIRSPPWCKDSSP
jgi:hypothetical protein